MKIPRGEGFVSNRQTSTGQISTAQTNMAVSGASAALSIAQQWKQQKDHSQVQEAMNTAIKKTNDWKAQNLTRTGKDAEGLTEDYLKFNQDLESELGSNLSNNAKETFNDWSIHNSESNRMSVMTHQKQQDDFVKQSAFADGINIAHETVRTDATQWPQAVQHLNNTLVLGTQSGVIKPEEYETKKTQLTNQLRNDIGKSYYTQDKHEFMKDIHNFGFGEPEIAAYKEKYQKDLLADQREQKSLFAEEAKNLYGKRDDMKAQAVANEDTSHFFDGAKKLRQMGYESWAKQLEEDGNRYNKVVSFNEDNKNKPLKEIVQAAQNLGVGSKLDGSNSDFQSTKDIQDEVKKQAKIYDADPAQYVSKWAQGSNMEEILDSRLSLQQKQGLYPSKGFQVLTKQEQSNFKGAWESGDTSQKTDLVLDSFRYGKHTPRVLDEVGVNSSLALAPMIGFDQATGVNRKDVEMLVAGAGSKPIMMDDSQKSEYRTAARNSDFYNTLLEVQKKFPTNPSLPQKIKDIEDAMTGIGARMVKPSGGAEFFDGKIDTVNSDDKNIYFPKSLDSDEVESVLDKRKDLITNQFKTGDKKKDLSSKWAIRDAVWVNSSSGFVLADPRSGAYIDGSQIDMLELEPVKKDLAKKKLSDSENNQTVTLSGR